MIYHLFKTSLICRSVIYLDMIQVQCLVFHGKTYVSGAAINGNEENRQRESKVTEKYVV